MAPWVSQGVFSRTVPGFRGRGWSCGLKGKKGFKLIGVAKFTRSGSCLGLHRLRPPLVTVSI